MLETANKRYPNIKLIYEINSIVSFLDVQIEKQHDHLITSVYHKPAAESHVVPAQTNRIESELRSCRTESSRMNDFFT
jgi:hypothetical protein